MVLMTRAIFGHEGYNYFAVSNHVKSVKPVLATKCYISCFSVTFNFLGRPAMFLCYFLPNFATFLSFASVGIDLQPNTASKCLSAKFKAH